MTLSLKHIGLLAGIVLIFVSFLFFGRQHGTYQVLSIGGLAIAFGFYIAILFGKGHLKTKIFWTVFIVIGVIVQYLTEPFLRDISYRIFISQNKNTLTEINNILLKKQDDITILNGNISEGNQLSISEGQRLREASKELGAYIISKSDNRIYYGLWGFLDVRLGITYSQNKSKPGSNYWHLTGSWFR